MFAVAPFCQPFGGVDSPGAGGSLGADGVERCRPTLDTAGRTALFRAAALEREPRAAGGHWTRGSVSRRPRGVGTGSEGTVTEVAAGTGGQGTRWPGDVARRSEPGHRWTAVAAARLTGGRSAGQAGGVQLGD